MKEITFEFLWACSGCPLREWNTFRPEKCGKCGKKFKSIPLTSKIKKDK